MKEHFIAQFYGEVEHNVLKLSTKINCIKNNIYLTLDFAYVAILEYFEPSSLRIF